MIVLSGLYFVLEFWKEKVFGRLRKAADPSFNEVRHDLFAVRFVVVVFFLGVLF
jgi:hypothetical protein